jgi:hypothetical protein
MIKPTPEQVNSIIYEVQKVVDTGFELFSLEQYIDCCDDLDDDEKEWAKENLSVAVTAD